MKKVYLILGIINITLLTQCELTEKKYEDQELEEISQLIITGDSINAIELLEESFLKDYPDNDVAWTILGNLYEYDNKYQKAKNAFEKATEINVKNENAYTGLGIIHRKLGQYDKAMEYYQKSIEINPEYGQAYSSMGAVAMKMKDLDKAQDLFEKAYELDPNDPVIASNLSIAYHHKGFIAKRDQMFQIAKELGYQHLDNLKHIYNSQRSIF